MWDLHVRTCTPSHRSTTDGRICWVGAITTCCVSPEAAPSLDKPLQSSPGTDRLDLIDDTPASLDVTRTTTTTSRRTPPSQSLAWPRQPHIAPNHALPPTTAPSSRRIATFVSRTRCAPATRRLGRSSAVSSSLVVESSFLHACPMITGLYFTSLASSSFLISRYPRRRSRSLHRPPQQRAVDWVAGQALSIPARWRRNHLALPSLSPSHCTGATTNTSTQSLNQAE